MQAVRRGRPTNLSKYEVLSRTKENKSRRINMEFDILRSLFCFRVPGLGRPCLFFPVLCAPDTSAKIIGAAWHPEDNLLIYHLLQEYLELPSQDPVRGAAGAPHLYVLFIDLLKVSRPKNTERSIDAIR